MQKQKKDKHFLKKPWYPGGRQALMAFISQHKRYPEEAQENGIEGTVSLKYTIDHKGNVIDAKIINGIGYGCDEEAIRLVKMLKFKVPRTYKVKVLYYKDMHIHFRKPQQKQQAVTYQYTSKSPEVPSAGYNYTVTIQRKKQ